MLVIACVFLVVCMSQLTLGYVPWAAIACLAALYLLSPLALLLFLLVGGAVMFFNRPK